MPLSIETLTEKLPLWLLDGLAELCRSEGVRTSTAFSAAYSLLRQRYSIDEAWTGGSDVGADFRPDAFTPSGLSGQSTFRMVLEQLRARDLEEGGGVLEGDASPETLFDICLTLGDAPPPTFKFPAVDLRWSSAPNRSPGDFHLSLGATKNEFLCTVEYSTDVFEAETIRRFVGHLRTFFEALAANPDQPIADLPLLPEAERKQLVEISHGTQRDYPREFCLHQLIELQAERSPEAPALVFESETLTYRQLNERANQLAHHLRKLGVGPDVLVGICAERSLEMIIALLGVIKAGGAYIPLDPENPRERLAVVLEDAAPVALLTQERLLPVLPETSVPVLCLDRDWQALSAAEPITNPESTVTPFNQVYVIFTSGSTGKPKGVSNVHRGIVNHLFWMQHAIPMDSADRIIQKTPYTFDVSVWEIFWPLMAGSCLVIARPQGHKDANYLIDLIVRHRITNIHFVPAMLRMFLKTANVEHCTSLRRVLLSGEALAFDLAQEAIRRLKVDVHDLYGPTEASVHVTHWQAQADDPRKIIPIGRPIWNTQMYVLDKKLNPMPMGVPGELHIGGVGVARGYLNRPELTAEKFIPDPFSETPGARLYKTGDLARFLSDGAIEYLGRIDTQVKLRGFRIELGEIEKTLESNADVRQSVVVALDDPSGEKRLVAYVIPRLPVSPRSDDTSGRLALAQHASEWAKTYDEVYSRSDPNHAKFNIVGWNSSYTGQPIPPDEMKVWVETTVERILALRPKRVLEIGCGTGLLLFRVAPHCDHYHGTDISQTAVDLLEQQVSHAGTQLSHVTLERAAAHESNATGREYDAVIINSVSQYLLDIDLFASIIENAAAAVRPGGTIFIGDVRNFALLDLFHTSVQFYRAPDALAATELRQRIRKKDREESELLIDPDFFTSLPGKIPRISGVAIEMKRGSAHNELTRFRYDVFLKVDDSPAANVEAQWLDWNRESLSLDSLVEFLRVQQPEFLGLSKVPNRRLAADLEIARLLRAEKPPATVADIRNQVKQLSPGSMEPDSFWALEQDLPYRMEIRPARDGSFNLLLRHKKASSSAAVRFPEEASGKDWSSCATHPLQVAFSREVVAHLRHFLHNKLPEYMVPSLFVLVDSIPLTSSGKVDRRALPAPDWARPEGQREYVAPQNQLEETIAAIFRDALKVERVGREDDFFEIGGHSLAAAQAATQLGQQLQLEIPLRSLFESPTVAALAQAMGSLRHSEPKIDLPSVVPVKKHHGIPLSIAQEALWYEYQIDPNSPVYNVPLLSHLRGELDPRALEKALFALVERHEILRTAILSSGGSPVLFPLKKWRGALQQADLRHLTPGERETEAWQIVNKEAARPFDLARDPLLRCLLIRLTNDEWIFLHNSPHIVLDGGSLHVFYSELSELYNRSVEGRSMELPGLAFQFADFAAWQRRVLEGEYLNSLSQYWKKQLTGTSPIDLPTDFPRPAVHRYRGTRRFFAIDPELLARSNAFFRAAGSTAFRGMYAAFNVFLYCYSGLEDICMGSPTAPINRASQGVENLIGFFVNTVCLRTHLGGDPSFQEVLRRAESVVDGAMGHCDLPFVKVVEALQLKRDPSRPLLFQINFRALNQLYPALEVNGIRAEPAHYVDTGTSKFDLALEVETSLGKTCYFEYRTDLFREETIRQMEQDFQNLLRGLIARPGIPIREVPEVAEISGRMRKSKAGFSYA